MNKTLLVNRIDPGNYPDSKKKIFFLIGKMNTLAIEEKLMEILKDIDILEKTDIMYKYNGVELNIKVSQIPQIIKILANNNMEIYSVYKRYNPEI